MSNDYQEFGFGSGDNDISSGKFDRFKAKEGETYRISFVWWPTGPNGKINLDAPSPKFIAAKRHFVQGAGYFLSKGPEWDRLAGATPKTQIATVIVIWPTNRKGELDKQRFAEGDVDVKPWIFGQDKYEQLKRRHNEFSFGSYDLTIACTDTQFQKMDLSPARENLFRKALENDKLSHLVKVITDQVDAIVRVNDKGVAEGLRSIIARDLSLDQIREKLGMSPAPSASMESSVEMDDLLSGVLDD